MLFFKHARDFAIACEEICDARHLGDPQTIQLTCQRFMKSTKEPAILLPGSFHFLDSKRNFGVLLTPQLETLEQFLLGCSGRRAIESKREVLFQDHFDDVVVAPWGGTGVC